MSGGAEIVSPTGTFTESTTVIVRGVTAGSATLTATITNPDGGGAETVGLTSFSVYQPVPTSLQLVSGSSTQEPVASCPIPNMPNGAGWQRNLQWQVLDQNGKPIQQAGMSASDSLANAGGTNSCGFPATGGHTGTGSTGSNGRFPDTYTTCSTACLNNGSCQSTEYQTWTVNGQVLSGDVKTVVYTCNGITVNGQ